MQMQDIVSKGFVFTKSHSAELCLCSLSVSSWKLPVLKIWSEIHHILLSYFKFQVGKDHNYF